MRMHVSFLLSKLLWKSRLRVVVDVNNGMFPFPGLDAAVEEDVDLSVAAVLHLGDPAVVVESAKLSGRYGNIWERKKTYIQAITVQTKAVPAQT
jgi:hypothetical protein